MVDPRREAVLVANRGTEHFVDKTLDVVRYAWRADGKVKIVFTSRASPYLYGAERVRILGLPERVRLTQGQKVEVDGVIWDSATEVCTFPSQDGSWSRVFYPMGQGEAHRIRPASQVRIVSSAADSPRGAGILSYWRTIVSGLPSDDPLRPVYDSLNFVHPESALGRFWPGHRSSPRN